MATHHFSSVHGAAALALLLLAGVTPAQTLYRSVGPDGRTTFSDRATAATSTERRSMPASTAPSAGLPFDLREPTSRFPVVVYTAPDCAPCADARTLLGGRGVPFAERTVVGNDDIAALRTLSGESSLPYATVGSQPLRGFSVQEWQRLLDAAGYPKTSQLPAGWRAAAATPLAPRTETPVAPAQTTETTTARAANATARSDTAGAVAPAGNNPAGIRF